MVCEDVCGGVCVCVCRSATGRTSPQPSGPVRTESRTALVKLPRVLEPRVPPAAEPPSGPALRQPPRASSAALTAASSPSLPSPRCSAPVIPAFPWDSSVMQSLHPLPETPAGLEQPLADVFPCTLLFCRITNI